MALLSIPRITGRQARELLDGATPGPWQAYDPGDGTARLYGDMNTCHYPDEDEDDRGVRLFHSTSDLVPAHAMAYMERRDGLLAAAAPALAETVTWLYWANSHPGDFGWRRWPLGGSWSVGLRDGQISIGPEGGGLGFRTPEDAEDAARALLAAAEEARP